MKRVSVVAVLFSACVASTGCAGDPAGGPGFGSAGAAGSRPAVVPTGDVPASKSMTQKYGITRWRMFSGVHHTTVTGYRADGTAARGVDLAWFQRASDGTPGHVRLAMLDGSGAVVRRYVGGQATGQLTPDQMELVVTQQIDFYEHFLSLVPGQKKAKSVQKAGSLHLDDNTSSAPNTGPQCSAALAGGNLDGTSCVLDIAGAMMSSETILGAMAGAGQAVYDCGSWAIQSNNVQSTCDTENLTHCTVATDGSYENCDFSSEQTGSSSSTPPPQGGGGLTQQDLCANYPNSQACSGLVKTNGFCSSSDQCAPGNECNQGFCSTAGYTGVPGDDCTNPDAVKYGGGKCSTSSAPTDQEVGSASSSSSCLSCAPGSSDVTPNPQNGDVTSSGGSGSSGSSSGGNGGSGSSGGGSGDDPGGGLGGNGPSCAGQSGDCSNGGSCCSPLVCDPGTSTCVSTSQMIGGSCTAYYGDACSSDADCCLGSCDASSKTCSSGDTSGGSSGGGSSSGSSSGGGSCASDGASCSADGDCCSGTCDASSGTCGNTGGGSSGGSSSGSSSGGSCAPDGASCSADGDCCGGSCDTSTGTCGSGSGSSSGGSSSGGSSGGGSCSQDGSSCSSASDCCSQNCGSCDGTCGGNSAGAAGAPCSSDSDCCNSCDTSNGVCL